jgi:hypothetical protein
MGEHPAVVRNLVLGSIALLVVVVLARAGRRDESDACPREFPQTRLAATLLLGQPGQIRLPSGGAPTPEDVALLVDPEDSGTCARLAALVPDSLAIGGPAAPFFTPFYRVGGAFVVPIVPRVSRAEIEAEARGETILWKEGLTLVFDGDFQPLFQLPN